jgi:serine/threonine protein kinase/Skp family chaperone for outer membrane proteins
MTPERWAEIKEVLAPLLEMPAAERPSYLDGVCAGNAALRREVDLLLENERDVSSRFMNQAALSKVAEAVLPEEKNPWIGRRVGAYQIVEQIGAGGMGEVYRAFRADDQYRKEVALKVVRPGHDSKFVIARFRNERQILASLEHSNIARLLDGGTTEDGVPYLVMELIEGEPIAEYCDARKLSIPERLGLFLKVCDAVQYAHQRLIVHRDIKPGNILVTGDGIPKLLDFGIGKILDAPSGPQRADTTLTIFRALTPQYASPEQVRGEHITTASDVYSLGVVLYELLTGQSPYPKSATSQDAARAVCELEPAKPSTAVRGRSGTSEAETIGSAASPEKLAKQLSGDLDNIVLMALRKESERRYASVQQFADDIRRSLEDLPIMARKDTARYRTSKFVVRHKAGVAAASAVVLILIAGMAITTREARVAERHFNDVRSLTNSLIFDVHDSIKELPGSTPARKIIIDRALQYLNLLAQESKSDVSLQRELAAAYERVGSVQGDYLENNLGDSEGTLTSYKKALEIRKQIDAKSNDWNDRLALAQEYRLVAHQQWANGDPRGARDPIDRAVAISESLNNEHPKNSKVLYELGFDHEVSGRIGYPGDNSANLKMLQDYRSALAVDEIALKLNPDDVRTLHGYSMDLNDVSNILEVTDPREALKSYQKGLEIDLKLTHLSTDVRFRRSVAIAYGNIASVYDDLGDYRRAVENNMKDLAIYEDLVRADPKNALLQQGLAITYMNTAASSARAGKLAPAMDYSGRGLEIMRKLVASAPEKAFQRGIFAATLVVRGTILTAANQPEAAITEIERGRSIYESLYKAGTTDYANVAACDVKLGEAAIKAGEAGKAADYFHRALTIVEPLISTQSSDLDALYAAADAYTGLGDLSTESAQHAAITKQQRKSEWQRAQSWYQQSLNTWHRIEHPNHTAPSSFQVGDPATVAADLKLAEVALASAH